MSLPPNINSINGDFTRFLFGLSNVITHLILAFLFNIDNREGEGWASHTCECHCCRPAVHSWTWSFNIDHLTLVSFYPPSVI